MTAPAIAPITVEERLAILESTLAAFIAEERDWRSQFVAEQREYRREVNARFDAQSAALMEHRRETNARFDALTNTLAEHRREINARFDAQADDLREFRRESNARSDDLVAELREHRRQTDDRMARMESNINRMYIVIIGFMGAVIVTGVGGVIAILASNG